MSEEAAYGALLRAFRQAAGLTIEELSHASGVSVRAIGDMERGVSRSPQRRTVSALAEVLRLAPEDQDTLLAAARAGRQRPTGSPAGICELPRGAGDFTGREHELGVLRALASRGSGADDPAVTATVWGPAGMGKTSLAVHAADRLADLFPDGMFFLDLRGMDEAPLTSGAGMVRLLKALGVAERRIPADDQESAGLYRALLRERRCLIVLDNAADEGQVRALLPGTGPSMALITSRRPLSGLEDVTQVPLAELAEGESVALLRDIVGESRSAAEPGAVDELARLCGHLPLAMRIAGNRLQSRPSWTVGQLVGRLSDEGRRLDTLAAGDLQVASAFALSYEQLTPTAGRTFRRLALTAAPDFGIPITAVLTELGPDDGEDALEELVDLGLLSSPYAGRYLFHDLVRLYARARLEQEEPAEEQHRARVRMEAWLLEVTTVAGRWFEPDHGAPPPEWGDLVGLDSLEHANDWLHTESTAWLAAMHAAAARGAHAAVVEAVDSLEWFLGSWRRWPHWPEVCALAISSAQALGDLRAEARSLNLLAHALTEPYGDIEQSEAAALRALELGRETDDVREQGRALYYAGRSLRDDLASLERNLDHGRRAAELLRQAGDRENYPEAMTSLIGALRRAGRTEEALEVSLELVAALRDPAATASIHGAYHRGAAHAHLGTTYLALGRWEDAVGAYRQAMVELLAYTVPGDLQPEAVALTQHRLATALLPLGRTEEARAALAEAARLYQECGNPEQATVVLRELGDLEESAGPEAATAPA